MVTSPHRGTFTVRGSHASTVPSRCPVNSRPGRRPQRETQAVHVWELAAIRAQLREHGLDWEDQ